MNNRHVILKLIRQERERQQQEEGALQLERQQQQAHQERERQQRERQQQEGCALQLEQARTLELEQDPIGGSVDMDWSATPSPCLSTTGSPTAIDLS